MPTLVDGTPPRLVHACSNRSPDALHEPGNSGRYTILRHSPIVSCGSPPLHTRSWFTACGHASSSPPPLLQPPHTHAHEGSHILDPLWASIMPRNSPSPSTRAR